MKAIENIFLWTGILSGKNFTAWDDGTYTVTDTANGSRECSLADFRMAKQRKAIEDTTQAAYSRYCARERARNDTFSPAIKYDVIVCRAAEYLYAMSDVYRERVKNGYRKNDCCYVDTPRNANVKAAYDRMYAAQNVLYELCDVTGVPAGAAIRAARAMDKWYRTACNHEPDAEKLLRALA